VPADNKENDDLIVTVTDDVLRLTINRPEKRNALSMGLLEQLGAALRAHRNTPVKCAVLTGAGDRAFAAGGDLKELDAIRSDIGARVMSEHGHAALDQVRYFPVPVIGALNGLALGGGAELAMACDLRIAAAHAELGLIQAQLNVTTAWGGGIDLINAVGNSAALAILCSGRRIDATEAARLCLYEAVCPEGDDFGVFVEDFLRGYLSKSINVLRSYKATAAVRRRRLHDELTDVAQQGFITAWVHDDHWDAAAKALKK
jgi:enoyl-CoA hydratase/carnithine racemase